ncbi:MAG: acetate--CoA ligase family protein [Oligoflexia bacterium]|nr:acetate--CoA ligase family protein [Oligoflexia bacterium]
MSEAGVAEVKAIVEAARAQGRDTLYETEGMALLAALGIRVPRLATASDAESVAALDFSGFPGDKVVLKAISHEILHKSDVGAVAIVPKTREAVARAAREMARKLEGQGAVAGYSLNEFVPYDPALGGELLVSLRFTEDFGPVVTLGAGGIHAEFLSSQLRSGHELAVLSPELCASGDARAIGKALQGIAVTQLATGALRGQKPKVELAELVALIGRLLSASERLVPELVSEAEINPLVVARDGGLVALDALVKLGRALASLEKPRPLSKLSKLLEPCTLAIVGVSSGDSGRPSPGRIILENTLKEGFARERIRIIKPGESEIAGCRCYPDIASLPEAVDLCVLAIPAAQIPATVTALIEHRKAESIIVIPGGLEEKAGTEALVARMKDVLSRSRETAWQGPVINGGNCLGVRSLPGKLNTLFIPEHKLPLARDRESPVALLSQSGAFAISRLNKLGGVNPRYAITLGNQTDLTIADYLEYLKDDRAIEVFAVYVEGFKPLDGRRFLRAAREIVASGRQLILYRAGRTTEGAQASASHTASIAGNFAVTRELCRQAGVVVAESIADFEDLLKLFTLLRRKPARGRRLGALSNAGFECVAIADALGGFRLAPFAPETAKRIGAVFERARIGQIVDLHNPLDLTPMCADADYEEIVRSMLEDPGIDAGLVACVPLTPSLQTLEVSPSHREDVASEHGLAARLGRLAALGQKPWVAVVDGGGIYDAFAARLERSGIPVFREADRALRLFEVFCAKCNE